MRATGQNQMRCRPAQRQRPSWLHRCHHYAPLAAPPEQAIPAARQGRPHDGQWSSRLWARSSSTSLNPGLAGALAPSARWGSGSALQFTRVAALDLGLCACSMRPPARHLAQTPAQQNDLGEQQQNTCAAQPQPERSLEGAQFAVKRPSARKTSGRGRRRSRHGVNSAIDKHVRFGQARHPPRRTYRRRCQTPMARCLNAGNGGVRPTVDVDCRQVSLWSGWRFARRGDGRGQRSRQPRSGAA
jgi:hypothetical protein